MSKQNELKYRAGGYHMKMPLGNIAWKKSFGRNRIISKRISLQYLHDQIKHITEKIFMKGENAEYFNVAGLK